MESVEDGERCTDKMPVVGVNAETELFDTEKAALGTATESATSTTEERNFILCCCVCVLQ